ncbi:YbaB/EbfC DNA-binding family protein [Prauserella shujinwangii]|uniref:YbaB/EbfC DNA-binding family protein n=1 Tax=Prauserella shujinwangii TaxID=1453103 RepID=A0A2T0LSE5_9PSEU|nr:YbaB/EbfC family nucleoid-associated protein [Prauserella shujinwangii]PRX46535.1 YbaB/EbfC DNA-binding family protein [Prauserella shujinwangii]
MPDTTDASERMIDEWTRTVQQRAERYQAMAAKVETLSITERSRDGLVEVTVDAKGLLTGVTIAESAQGRRMAEISQLIMRTVRAAQARLPELLQQAMAETIGTEDQAANKIFEDARRQFPAPPEDEQAPEEPRREMSFGPEDDEPPAPPPPQNPQPPPPRNSPPPRERPRGRSRDDDEDDFGGRSILS